MNNIDILEEMFFDNETFEPIGYIETNFTKEQQQAIKNLIAENKELKEENLHWKGQYHLLSRKIDVIPKSKVVEELKKAISEEIDTSKAMFEGDFTNGYIFALQSLLGKE